MPEKMTKETMRNNSIHVALIGLLISIDRFLETTEGEDIGVLDVKLEEIFKKLTDIDMEKCNE